MDGDFRNECRELLLKLKSTVEVLLGNHTTNVWNTYGGLSRLTTVVCNILKHRLKREQGPNADCWNFIMGLRVLIPTIAPWLERHRLATEGSSDRSYLWVQQLLQEHTLSTYLKVLFDDHNHLKACYHVGAFLRLEPFGESLLTCLRAVENNKLELLAHIDPTLLVDNAAVAPRHMGFTRSPSLPERVSGITQQCQPKEASSFVTTCSLHEDNRTQHQVASNSGFLHRTCPVDPSKGPYYRERCGQQVQKERDKDLEMRASCPRRHRPMPKSCTWDSALSWEKATEHEIPPRLLSFGTVSRVKTARSISCECLHHFPGETAALPSATSSAAKRLTKSMPSIQIVNCSAAQKRHTIPICPKETKVAKPAKAEEAEFYATLVHPPRVNTGSSMEHTSSDSIWPARKLSLPSSSVTHETSKTEPASAIGNPASPRTFTKNIQKPVSSTPHLHRSPTHVRSKSDIGITLNVTSTIYEGEANRYPMPCAIPMSSSLPTILPDDMETNRVLNETYVTPIFRRPMEGQSLTSFLSSQDFRTCAELDKENAHFSISEALISAIEQVKCNQMLKIAEEQDEESDDEEIKHLKQRIRIRRRERLQEKVMYQNPQQLLSDGCTDTTTTSQSPSPRSTSSENKSDENTSDSIDPIDLSDGSEIDSKLSTLHESGLSLSMASLYSDADIQRPNETLQSPAQETSEKSRETSAAESNVSHASAESVALSLLRKFSEKQLPKASDLEWLVSEQDAPQKLLPLPTSWPISPDDADNITHHLQTRLRGNLEWAPPRQQIIFNIHPTPQKVIMAKQNYRCAGCGTKIEQGFMKRFRYCEYLGKYFCQCCHNNSLAYIPGRILRKWDFNKYYVSNFSRDLLQKMCADPLYDISDVNPTLYRRVKALHQVHQYRRQLYHIKDFIRACRNGQSFVEELEKQPNHLFDNPHLYSLVELIQVKSGEMLNRLKPMVARTLAHVAHCELCQARGFFCEFCKNDQEVIFPFQLLKVTQCQACWSCYHTECYVPEKCPKCFRIESRKQHLLQPEEDYE